MLILPFAALGWTLYCIGAAVLFLFLCDRLSFLFKLDWLSYTAITVFAVLWPITVTLSLFEAFYNVWKTPKEYRKADVKYYRGQSEPYSILVPLETWGIDEKDRYEKVAAYIMGKEND